MTTIDLRFAAAHRALTTVAVTGTNGKSTTTSMIERIVRASGEPSARLTTLGAWVAGVAIEADTPNEVFLRTVERAAQVGVRTLALEVTSKALAQGLARRWLPTVAVFTNLSRDHMDMHGSPEAYLAAKAQLFMALPERGVAVLNADDPASELILELMAAGRESGCQIRQFSVRGARLGGSSGSGGSSDLCARSVVTSAQGTRIELEPSALADALGGALTLSITGDVHAQNALAAALACHALGYPADAIRRGLHDFEGVPGRFQIAHREPLVVVDYAHTPDGLRGTLLTARHLLAEPGEPDPIAEPGAPGLIAEPGEPAPIAEPGVPGPPIAEPGGPGRPAATSATGRLICVFGCGGNRDRGKRPQMGAVAHELADLVVLTSDNPRREPPQAIADDIRAGARGPGATWHLELDRVLAIDWAVARARPGDVLVIAGKGHEDVQEIMDERIPMSDLELARAACARVTRAD